MRSRAVTRVLLCCGLLAGPLFTTAYLLEGSTRANYSAWRHPVSSLSLGTHGWMQVANFLNSGALLVGFGIGVHRAEHSSKWTSRLIQAIGVGLIGAGAFRCDPLSGYPPGTPAVPSPPTTKGILHVVFSALVFLGMPAVFLIDATGVKPVWSTYSKATFVAFVGTFGVARAGFAQSARLVAFGGLFQRLALSIGFTWLALRAAQLLGALARS
ncbi:MAG: DUF998 domain-containing protein [Chloroflexi bacterium]|nr:DUF998 domain-containing protein [Chloroflexota bacterium]